MSVDIDAKATLSQSPDLERRIEATFLRDKIAAGFLIIVLWITVLFVMLSVRSYMTDAGVEVLCWAGAALLLLFNTSSILAMIRHYGEDKAHIYAVDIRHLDAGR